MTTLPLEPAAPASAPFVFAAARAPRWYGVLIIVLFALVMPIGYLGDEGEALVSAIGGAAALSFVLQRRPPSIGVLILAALTVWAVASFAWSPMLAVQAHPHTYKQFQAIIAPKLLFQLVVNCALVSGALKLASDQRARALDWMSWTLVGAVAIMALDAAAGGKIYNAFNHLFGRHDLTPDLAQRDAARGCYAAALLFWPVALFTARRVPLVAPIVAAVAIVTSSVRLGEDAPAVALALSMLVYAGMQVNARIGAWGCTAGSALYFLAAPVVFLPRGGVTPPNLPADIGKASWRVRLDIWRFASQLIRHRPITGYGLDASRAFEPRIPMHPHDAALQLWLELGVPGALLAALFFGWLFHRIGRLAGQDPMWAAIACATAFVYLFIGAVSFGVWQEWWLALGAVAVAACGMVLLARREGAQAEAGVAGLQAL